MCGHGDEMFLSRTASARRTFTLSNQSVVLMEKQ
jgi:hypothetical protein